MPLQTKATEGKRARKRRSPGREAADPDDENHPQKCEEHSGDDIGPEPHRGQTVSGDATGPAARTIRSRSRPHALHQALGQTYGAVAEQRRSREQDQGGGECPTEPRPEQIGCRAGPATQRPEEADREHHGPQERQGQWQRRHLPAQFEAETTTWHVAQRPGLTSAGGGRAGVECEVTADGHAQKRRDSAVLLWAPSANAAVTPQADIITAATAAPPSRAWRPTLPRGAGTGEDEAGIGRLLRGLGTGSWPCRTALDGPEFIEVVQGTSSGWTRRYRSDSRQWQLLLVVHREIRGSRPRGGTAAVAGICRTNQPLRSDTVPWAAADPVRQQGGLRQRRPGLRMPAVAL